MSQSWVDYYRPETWDEIEGNNKAIKQIKKWSENFTEGDKPWLLHGDQGTGKTSTAEVVAKENDWPIEEINASDTRSTDDIKTVASLIRNKPIQGDFKLVLIDECDSFHRGVSLGPLKKVLDDPPNPVIFTANEHWKVPDGIKNKCNDKKFSLRKNTKKSVINDIVEKEGLDLNNRQIGKLATRDDLRSIINDLQRYADTDTKIAWDERDLTIGNFKAVDNVIRGKKYTGEVSPPDMVAWLDENISGRFDGVESMRAYQALAEADRWLNKANETQNYTYWRYAGSITDEVANLRVTEPYDGWINKSFPKAWRNSTSRAKDKSPEATLYREIKDTDSDTYKISGNYKEFENIILPFLQRMDDEEKYQLILSEGFSPDAYEALDVTQAQYENWQGGEIESEESVNGEEEDTSENGGEDEEMGLFDF